MIGNRRVPAQLSAVLDHQIEECVHHVHTALGRDLRDVLSDDRGVGAFGDLGVGEVAMPDARAELLLEVGTEPAAVGLVREQLVAAQLFSQMQRGAAGAELLEHHEIDAVGIHVERGGEVLPAELALARAVDHPGERAEDAMDPRRRLGIGRRQQRDLERSAADPGGRGEEEQHVVLGVQVRNALQQPTASTQNLVQRTEFAPPRIRGRQRTRPVSIAVQLVPRVRHGRHSEQPGIERLLERVGHGMPFLASGLLTAIG